MSGYLKALQKLKEGLVPPSEACCIKGQKKSELLP